MAKPDRLLKALRPAPWRGAAWAVWITAVGLLALPGVTRAQGQRAVVATDGSYSAAEHASQRWVLCAVVPHIKDAYWLGVNYGMAEEAKRLGVEVRMAEAGGYSQVVVQREQISTCARDARVKGILVGAVTRDVLTPELRQATAHVPVVGMVNAIADAGIAGKVGVNWEEMGAAAGTFLVSQVSGDGPQVPVAWFPGPRSVSEGVDRKFREAIAGSRIVIRSTSWGDTGKAVQRNLLQQVLDRNPDVRYVVGNALMAEVAISVLRERGLRERIGIVSTYFTPAIHRGILRGSVMAAATDSPVLQGRMAIGMAVDLLEKRPVARHIAPPIRTVDAQTVHTIDVADSLPPALLAPQFVVLPVPAR